MLLELQQSGRVLGVILWELLACGFYCEGVEAGFLLGKKQSDHGSTLLTIQGVKLNIFSLGYTVGYIHFTAPATSPKGLASLHVKRPNIGTLAWQLYQPGARLTMS